MVVMTIDSFYQATHDRTLRTDLSEALERLTENWSAAMAKDPAQFLTWTPWKGELELELD